MHIDWSILTSFEGFPRNDQARSLRELVVHKIHPITDSRQKSTRNEIPQ